MEKRKAHQILQSGGSFLCRDLQSDGDPFRLELPRCTIRAPLWSHQEIQTLPDGVYGWGRNEKFAAVDAICQPDLMYQLTVSEQHGINTRGLASAATKLRSGPGDAKLIFAVPPDVFTPDVFTHDFSKQTPEGNQRKARLGGAGSLSEAVCHPDTYSALDSGHIHRSCITSNTANGVMMAFRRHDLIIE